MDVNAKMYDKALHEIPIFVQSLENMIGQAKKLELDILEFRKHLIQSVQDKGG